MKKGAECYWRSGTQHTYGDTSTVTYTTPLHPPPAPAYINFSNSTHEEEQKGEQSGRRRGKRCRAPGKEKHALAVSDRMACAPARGGPQSGTCGRLLREWHVRTYEVASQGDNSASPE